MRQLNFFEETVPQMTDEQFKEQFHLSRATVAEVMDVIGEREENPVTGLPPTDRKKQVLLTLWYLGSMVSFRKVAMLFGLALSTAWSHVAEVATLLVNLKGDYIKMPRIKAALDDTRKVFERLKDWTVLWFRRWMSYPHMPTSP